MIFVPLNSLLTHGLEGGDNPAARYAHRMVYYPEDESIILFGGEHGYSTGVYLDTVWSFDLVLKSWTNLGIDNGPCARMSHGLIYDSTTNKIILFGGMSTENYSRLSDTWLLDLELNEWSLISTQTKPLPRSDFGFYYDPVIQAAVLFGGYSAVNTKYADTWLFFPHNNSWVDNYKPMHPLGSYGHQMVYDTNKEVGVFFGGRTGSTLSDETWHYNSTSLEWSQISISTKPIERYWHAMAYSSTEQKTYIFGGSNSNYPDESIYQTAVYDSDSQIWEALTLTNHPSARALSYMVCHEQSAALILFGGTLNYASDAKSDMWFFDISTQTWSEINYITTAPTSLNIANFVLIGIIVFSFFLTKSRRRRT